MNLNGAEYFYLRNAQGDIIGLIDGDGVRVVSYAYDSWGKLISIKDKDGKDVTTDTNHVGYKNPYRYRGYRYDRETGLYYLNSRYYNADWGRFINADGLIGVTGGLLSHNMFAYCVNNPVNMEDPSGQFAFLLPLAIGIIEAVAAVIISSIIIAPMIINEVSMIVSTYGSQLMGAAQNIADKISGDSGGSNNNGGNSGGKPPKYTKNNFKKNLENHAGKAPQNMKKPEAHHVLPQKFQQVFESKGINIHDPKFGTWVDKASHGKWSYEYNKVWDSFLKTNPSKQQILDFGRDLSSRYGFSINY